MAAAVELATKNVPVTVFEAAQTLGGRARRVVSHGAKLDNGLHILIGAYSETSRMIRHVRSADQPQDLLRLPLQLQVEPSFRMRTWPLPAPLHVGAALLFASGLNWPEKMATARFMRNMGSRNFRCEAGTTVATLLREHRQPQSIIEYLWYPLCVSALNTNPEQADAQVFLNVLRDSLAGPRGSSDLLLPQVDFSALFPEPAAELVRGRGGQVRLGETVTSLQARDKGFDITATSTERFSDVIVAVAPHRLAHIVGHIPQLAPQLDLVRQFEYQPIYSVFLQYPQPVTLPAPMIGMRDSLVQWVFDRGTLCGQPGMMGVVISASGPHQSLTRDDLADQVHRQLAERFSLPEPEWTQVIAEKRATFACSPDLRRPANVTPVAGLLLAGDYTESPYPATLEAAVRSGSQCARLIAEGCA
ncbi:MAG: FAD-dependent oxidoreductase [Betaproteobacteria bacterium]|nr:MAG: FAD-dependent oxidoreductase [Betaproteobacteria bacterium]